MSKKYKILLIAVTLFLVCSIFLGTSYSLWRTSYVQQGTNEVNVGCFTITYTNLSTYGGNEAGDINLVNTYPITEASGLSMTPYVFKIKNECTIPANYSVNLETLNTSNFNTDYLRVKFNEASSSTGTSVLYKDITAATVTLSNATLAKQLATGYLEANEEVTYALRTWIDINATTETPNVMGRSWNGKVVVSSEATKANPHYTIVSGDLDTVGSVIKIADEEFYVIGQEDSTHVKLLSKWNLNVGSNAKGTATNLQDVDVRGYRADGGTAYGSVAYSGTNYWYDSANDTLKSEFGSGYPAWVYINTKENDNYIASIAEYVDNYVSYLTNQGVHVSGRLIKQEELIGLGCNGTTRYCDSSESHEGTASTWVYQTSYWTGSAGVSEYMWGVGSDGFFGGSTYSNVNGFGVRPVIILEK